MKACILTDPYQFELVDIPVPRLGTEEVLIRVRCVGICGTDVAVYRGDYKAKDRIILGHEYSGEVLDVGRGVRRFKAGDFVASAASWGCGACFWCEAGQPSYCERPNMLGRTVDGSLAEYIAMDERHLYRLAKTVTPLEGQAVVGLATALRAVDRSGLKVGGHVLIFGPGYSGLTILQLCKMAGAKVGMIGTREERLTLSKELGADFTENVKGSPGREKEMLKISGGHGFDICIEAAGTASAFLSALRLVKKGGTVVEFGTSIDLIDGLPQKDFYSREISIVGSKGGYGFYRKAIELLESHQIRIEPLITHTFTLEETPKAFEVMDRRLDKVIRAAVAVS